MQAIQYSSPAEIYVPNGLKGRRNNMAYRRFATAAEAIRFIMEDLSKTRQVGSVMEVNERRHYHNEIRALYEDDAFPLERQDKAETDAA